MDGRASNDWKDSWTNLGIWKNHWTKDGSNRVNILNPDTIREIPKDLFDESEIKVLKDLNILDEITKPN